MSAALSRVNATLQSVVVSEAVTRLNCKGDKSAIVTSDHRELETQSLPSPSLDQQ